MRKILLLTMFFILSPQLHADEAELLSQISELKAEYVASMKGLNA